MSFIGMSSIRCGFDEDTIAAISTAAGKSAIAIVRVSGKQAVSVADSIFRAARMLGSVASHTALYGHIVDADNEKIDEVLATVYLAPRTYTREDIVEIGCHGGSTAAKAILKAMLAKGVRMAEPGEFTKRAFLNGRIDLTQVEAITEIINSRTSRALKEMQRNLGGSMRKMINEIRDSLMKVVMYIEAEVDFPEEGLEPIEDTEIMAAIESALARIDHAIRGFEKGRLLREGLKLVIAGKPNVGKSSLMNALLRADRAIVTDIPGTTRDTIEESASVKGIPVVLTDTAGMRETSDVIESLGIERTREAIEASDVVLLVLDSSRPLDEEDEMLIKMTDQSKRIVVMNKIDAKSLEFQPGSLLADVEVSAVSGENMELLENIIEAFAGSQSGNDENAYAGSLRQQELLLAAAFSLSETRNAFTSGMPADIISVDLQKALYLLGEIVGDNGNEDVIHRIFGEFCLGK